jgi:hypothetical protein
VNAAFLKPPKSILKNDQRETIAAKITLFSEAAASFRNDPHTRSLPSISKCSSDTKSEGAVQVSAAPLNRDCSGSLRLVDNNSIASLYSLKKSDKNSKPKLSVASIVTLKQLRSRLKKS